MDALILIIQKGFSYIGPFFILLGLLVFIHELGHFLAAKFFNVRVEVFSLGFGKKILKFKYKETTYCISLIPLGGYVKMFGDNPTIEIPKKDQPFSFLHKPVWPRIIIVLAGPLMNLFFAIFLFSTIAYLGERQPAPFLGDISIDSSAYKAGFRSGDQIIKLDKKPIASWTDVDKYVKENPQKNISFIVNRENGQKEVLVQAQTKLIDSTDNLSWEEKVGNIEGLSITSQLSVIGITKKESMAYQIGLRNLDQIISINKKPVKFWRQLDHEFSQVRKKVELKVLSHRIKKPKESTVIINNWNPAKNFKAQLGVEKTQQYILSIKEDSPAQKAGLKVGEKIIKLDNHVIKSWDEILKTVQSYNKESQKMIFTLSQYGKTRTVPIAPQMTQLMKRNGQEEERFVVGIYPGLVIGFVKPIIKKTTSPIALLKRGTELAAHWTSLTVLSLWKLVTNEISHKNLAGVITIGKVAGESLQVGVHSFLQVMAIISINLFLLNLLPIPILDGGHLMFFLFEAISGSPLSLKKMMAAQQVGLIIMMALMAFALFNDITNILSPSW